MGSEWPVQTLKKSGVALIDCVHKTPKAVEQGYPYIGIPQMKAGRIDFEAGPRLIAKSDLEEWTKKANPLKDDVVLSRRCNPGETAHVSGQVKFALGQNLVLLRSDSSQVLPNFLRWLVRGPQWWGQVGKYLNTGAVFDSLKCADIPNFELPIPPLQEQQNIAKVLSAIDDKIVLNQQINTTLETMAQALFKSWFVDFDPVIDNALAAGNPIPEELKARADARAALGDQRKPLPDHIRRQFPDRFVLTEEIGWVPEGWEVRSVYDIAKFINGAAFKSEHFSGAAIAKPILKIAEIKNGVSRQTKFTTQTLDSKYQVTHGDILFSWSGNPDTSIDTFVWTGVDGWLNQHIFKVVTTSKTERLFTYYLLKHLKPVFADVARDKQTTGLGHVTVKDLKRLQTIKPPQLVTKLFEDQVAPLFQSWLGNLDQSNVLSKTRDILLPKLLSGELRVPEAEKKLEEVAL